MIKDFKEFIDEDTFSQQTLDIPRDQMPQISQDALPKFFKFLADNKVKYGAKQINVKSLRPTQSEFNQEKVDRMSTGDSVELSRMPILVSKDHYVLDGHHRYLALLKQSTESGKDIKINTWRVNLSAVDLLSIMKRFPLTFYKDLKDKSDTSLPDIFDDIFDDIFHNKVNKV